MDVPYYIMGLFSASMLEALIMLWSSIADGNMAIYISETK